MSDTNTSSAIVVDTTHSPHAKLRPIGVRDVVLEDRFFEPRRRINRERTIPSQYELCEKTARLDNFRRASGKKKDIAFQGIFFNDSDVYKWLEAAAWSLATHPDPALEKMVDTAITEVADAQQPDGYLNTYFMFEKAAERYGNLRDMHELYCAGHLIQAAVAHHRATGSTRLLNVARKLADHLCATFGPASEGKRPGACGHEEVEMAMVELARDAAQPNYLKQAQFFIDIRGHGHIGGDDYRQDHKPFRELDRMVGHAVRAVYLNTGAADVYAETGDATMLTALERQWQNMTLKQLYISGGIGCRYEGEAFGKDYELPNQRAYTETCAAIGSVMWNWRMLLITGEARFADLMEWQLYNAILPGLSLDGQAYFYQNPLADDGTHRRQEWFGCACCPPNVARLLSSLPGYFYSVSGDEVWLHLYAQGTARIPLADGRVVELVQETKYPWDGQVTVRVQTAGEFALRLRIPAWTEGTSVKLDVNGQPAVAPVTPGAYVQIRRGWRAGDIVHVNLPMPVQRIECHPYAAENADHVALTRGPLLYCIEQADNSDMELRDVVLPATSPFAPVFREDLLGGVVVLQTKAKLAPVDAHWTGRLYRQAQGASERRSDRASGDVDLTAIPYYAWANRQPGPMRVWLRRG